MFVHKASRAWTEEFAGRRVRHAERGTALSAGSPRASDRPAGAGAVASTPGLRYTFAMAGRAGSRQGMGYPCLWCVEPVPV